jgi:hypothetical protein
MGSPILELSNSANWVQAYSAETAATWVDESKGSHFPIPPMSIPFLFDQHIIAVYPESNGSKSWWFSAGWLEQKVSTGITVGGNPDVRVQDSQRILLNRINLAIFPKLSSTYQLNIDIPYWFSHYKVTIWEYIGPESDSIENLINQLQTDIQRIEGKIDAL